MLRTAGIGCIVYALACTAAIAAPQAEFFGLGSLPGRNSFSRAYGVSYDGRFVVGDSQGQPFLWSRDSGMVGLGFLSGGRSGHANAVSRDGTVVVGSASSTGSPYEAFRWTPSGGMVSMGSLPGGLRLGDARDVSADGKVIVGHASAGTTRPQAFRWTEETGMVGLGDLSPTTVLGSDALAISPDGKWITGWSEVPPTATNFLGKEGFLWSEADGMRRLSTAADWFEEGRDVSDNGVVVGLGRVGAPQAMSWTEAAGVVKVTERILSSVDGVSADGRIMVGNFASTGAFLWREGLGIISLREMLLNHGLDTTDWSSLRVHDVSADGMTLVGEGRHLDGRYEGWVAVLPIPEPSVTVLLLSALAPWAMMRRRGIRLP